jgi:hypothetical protein
MSSLENFFFTHLFAFDFLALITISVTSRAGRGVYPRPKREGVKLSPCNGRNNDQSRFFRFFFQRKKFQGGRGRVVPGIAGNAGGCNFTANVILSGGKSKISGSGGIL